MEEKTSGCHVKIADRVVVTGKVEGISASYVKNYVIIRTDDGSSVFAVPDCCVVLHEKPHE